jgi:5-bromo-4-chloroindolyl phosphate hydrolysis protein
MRASLTGDTVAVVDERARRIGNNEAVYRAINEKIEALNESFGTLAESMTVVCECGEMSCAEQIELDAGTYERVRSDPTHFVVVPGHELPEVEDVIEQTERYAILRKHPGTPARVARETDPRS